MIKPCGSKEKTHAWHYKHYKTIALEGFPPWAGISLRQQISQEWDYINYLGQSGPGKGSYMGVAADSAQGHLWTRIEPVTWARQ